MRIRTFQERGINILKELKAAGVPDTITHTQARIICDEYGVSYYTDSDETVARATVAGVLAFKGGAKVHDKKEEQ